MIVAVAALGGCGRPTAPDVAELVGQVSLPLTTSTNGHNYRLRNISLYVSGMASNGSYVSMVLNDNSVDNKITANLQTGTYSANLSNYVLEIDDGTGTYTAVRAQLVSYYLPFSIYNGVTTTLTFRFQTDAVVVTTGMGTLTTKVEVVETAPVCQPLSTSCGSGRWCPPFDLSGAAPACVMAGTVPVGAACAGPTDCVGNASCFDLGAGPICVTLCPSSLFNSACPLGGTCVAKGKTYGICETAAGADAGSGAGGEGGGAGDGGNLACDLCTFGPENAPGCGALSSGCFNCVPATDGCSQIVDPADRKLCEDLYACMVSSACIAEGDPLQCWCGANPTTCVTSNEAPTKANGPCVDQVTAAAKLATYDAATIYARIIDPNFPLGRAVNLVSCQSAFCSVECGVPF